MTRAIKEQSTIIAIAGAIGLTAIVIQADLIGHWFGFETSSTEIQALANPRLFFLAGYTATALVAIFVVRLSQRQIRTLAWFSVLSACVGALLYGFAYSPKTPFSDAFAIVGLIVYGAGYVGTTLYLYCELAKLRRLPVALWAIAASLFLKTVIGDAVGVISSGVVQVVVAALLPWISFICLSIMKKQGTTEHLERYRREHTLDKAKRRDLLYVLVAVSIILAALRGLGHLGLWGEGYFGSPIATFAGYPLVGLSLAGFTYTAIIRNSNDRMLIRFQPAFLILISGLLVYSLRDNLFDPSALEPVFSWLLLSIELFGHLLSWAVVLTGIRTTNEPVWRFQGISGASYGAIAIVWALLLSNETISEQVFVIFIVFFAMVAAIRPLSRKPAETEPTRTASPALDAGGEPTANRGDAFPSQTSASAKPENVSHHIKRRHRELAQKYNLSPRETDVFLLLAQGRSRPHISNELFLADGTVKTHISHIYRKLNVHTREEFLTVVYDAIEK